MRTLLHNLVVPGGGNERRPAHLLVDGERLAAVLEPDTPVGADEVVDLRGALVIPGAIDGHVHFDDPGFTHREDFATGTRAAAAGGVSMIVDMPCTSLPPVTSVANLETKLAVISAKAHVDFMLWGGVSDNILHDNDWRTNLARLVEAGVAAVKIYFLSGMETFRDVTPDQAREILSETRNLGIPVGVHAEDRAVVERSRQEAVARGVDTPSAYAAARPAEAEIAAVRTLYELSRDTGSRVHIVHLGSREALDIVSRARSEGIQMSAETCPHFLLFTGKDLDRLGAVLKTAPVVKAESDREGLWRGLADRELLFVASDHAAGEWPAEKHTGSIWTDYGGVPGVELLLPTLYSEGVARGRITLERMVELTSRAPADFFGLGQRKGRLQPGYDADFAVIDESATWTVRAEDLHNKNRYTPLEGVTLSGRVVQTWVRGRRVFDINAEDRGFDGKPGGRFFRRGEGR